jgi:branched-chain amino acid transport system substrate-binding protein
MFLNTMRVALAAAVISLATFAQGQVSGDTVKIGVLTDMSGVLSDLSGAGSVTAVRMAVEDFGGKVLGNPIEVVQADHQSKPDLASSLAREWIDQQGVDMITDLTNSAVALAVASLVRDKSRIAIVNGAGTTRITNQDCSLNTVHYTWDTYAMAYGTAKAIVKQGGDTWYFLTADYAFGHQSEKDVSAVVVAAGGKVLGSSKHPQGTSDFSSFILKAQQSGAKIIGLANGGADTINAVKAAEEFGLSTSGKQNLAGLAVFITDIHTLGLKSSQGLILTTGFYWDRDEETRKFSRRFFERQKKMPTAIQAGNYSSTLHYLKAVQAAGTDEAGAVMTKMKALPVNDFFATNGKIRQDGGMVHDMYLVQVKKPDESKYAWDY